MSNLLIIGLTTVLIAALMAISGVFVLARGVWQLNKERGDIKQDIEQIDRTVKKIRADQKRQVP